jgi:hypothetical protein
VLFILAISAAHGQTEQNQATRVADAMKKVKQGKFGLVDVEEIARAGAVQAIPELKEQFARSPDSNTKAKIASALVRLGDGDPIYWDLLVKQARVAVESDAPFPGSFDSHGKAVRQQLSPGFIQWAQAHHLVPDAAAETMMYELPLDLMFLASTGDPRAIELLRQGMSSDNYLIQAIAAKGLAKIQDKASIPIIIAACQKAPADASPAIAEALIFFDDPQAQAAADVYLPRDYANALRESRKIRGNDAFLH